MERPRVLHTRLGSLRLSGRLRFSTVFVYQITTFQLEVSHLPQESQLDVYTSCPNMIVVTVRHILRPLGDYIFILYTLNIRTRQ